MDGRRFVQVLTWTEVYRSEGRFAALPTNDVAFVVTLRRRLIATLRSVQAKLGLRSEVIPATLTDRPEAYLGLVALEPRAKGLLSAYPIPLVSLPADKLGPTYMNYGLQSCGVMSRPIPGHKQKTARNEGASSSRPRTRGVVRGGQPGIKPFAILLPKGHTSRDKECLTSERMPKITLCFDG